MPRFLIDVNLPYRALWSGGDYTHMRDLGETWTDTQIWEHDRRHDLVIVSKVTDFSDRAVVSGPPPRVIHIRFGNMKTRDFHALITRIWPRIVDLSADHKLIHVFQDRIEAVE